MPSCSLAFLQKLRAQGPTGASKSTHDMCSALMSARHTLVRWRKKRIVCLNRWSRTPVPRDTLPGEWGQALILHLAPCTKAVLMYQACCVFVHSAHFTWSVEMNSYARRAGPLKEQIRKAADTAVAKSVEEGIANAKVLSRAGTQTLQVSLLLITWHAIPHGLHYRACRIFLHDSPSLCLCVHVSCMF